MINLTIWMNFPSAHQADLFRALAASGEVDLRVIFAKRLPRDRAGLGWKSDLDGYAYSFLDERNQTADALRLALSQRKRIHIVNGIWAEPGFAAALVVLRAAGCRYAIYSEASEPELPRSTAKKLLRASFARLLTPKAAGILAVSRLAEHFFKSFGARDHAIYPFGYFDADTRLPKTPGRRPEAGRVEVIFVGQLIHRKGVDLLFEAMRPLFDLHPALCLSIVGGGELEPVLSERVSSAGLSGRINFEGVSAIDAIRPRVAASDVLVLPSRWDGWGMVVNEAFSVGVPVIVSDRCGAADLVRDGVNGYIFRSEDVEDLRRCLSRFIESRADWPCLRAAAKATGQRISVEHTVPYLIKCLKHMTGACDRRPVPPWREADVAGGAA